MVARGEIREGFVRETDRITLRAGVRVESEKVLDG